MNNIKIEDGAFGYLINDNIAITGAVDTDGGLVGLMVISQGDGSAISGIDVLSVMTSSYAAVMGG